MSVSSLEEKKSRLRRSLDAILETRGVRKSFGALVAVNDVSIQVPRQKITIIIGPNGSGKTTLINVISGVYKPEKGQIIFDGQDITGLPPHEIYRLGLVRTFQIPALWHRLTVLENMLAAAKDHPGEKWRYAPLKGKWRDYEESLVEKAFKILDFLGILKLWNRRSGELSGGQLRLLEVGRALMVDARMILMDEPLASLNPVIAREICEHLTRLRDELGITFLLIEHRLDIALDYVDHAYAMHRGRIIASGTPEEVVSNPAVIESYLGG